MKYWVMSRMSKRAMHTCGSVSAGVSASFCLVKALCMNFKPRILPLSAIAVVDVVHCGFQQVLDN